MPAYIKSHLSIEVFMLIIVLKEVIAYYYIIFNISTLLKMSNEILTKLQSVEQQQMSTICDYIFSGFNLHCVIVEESISRRFDKITFTTSGVFSFVN